MKNLINAYHQIIFKERPHTDFSHLKVIFENQMIKFKNVITEMNTNVYPIPFEDIDNTKPSRLSINLLKILQKPSEFKTFKVNLLNRLDKLSNKYFIQESIEDNIENKRKFLNELFSNAEVNENFDDFLNTIKEYDSSKLLESNMYFFWYMI